MCLNNFLKGFAVFLWLQKMSKETCIKTQPIKLCHVTLAFIAPSVQPGKEEK